MTWLDDMFDVPKPVIGMCHLMAMPGDPGYHQKLGMDAIVNHARGEVAALQGGGVDGILISNEFSLPYLTEVEPITTAAMARVIGEIKRDIKVPFGVNVLWDGRASIDLAVATGAGFVREIFSGVYASDFGLWNTNMGEVARHRRAVGAQDVRLLFNIVPEAASYLSHRDLASIARSTCFNAKPDALCVSGLTAGSSADVEELATVKGAAGGVPVIVNTGVNVDNIEAVLTHADAAIVGTFLKKDGRFENSVDGDRVSRLMQAARAARKSPVHV